MRQAGILGLAVVVGLGFTAASQAQTEVYSQPDQWQDGPVSDGIDGYFWNVRTWDNFTLSDPVLRKITEVTWWGSTEVVAYTHDENFAAWALKIYSDSGGAPGQLLYEETFDEAATDPILTGDRNGNGGWEYEHHVALSNPITLHIDEQYWISIGAILDDPGLDEWWWSVNLIDGDGVSLQDDFSGGGYFPYSDDVAFILWGEVASGCPRAGCEIGELDGDCVVNLNDLASLLSVYGLCVGDPGYNPAADISGNGCIDLADLAALLAAYGADCNY